MIFTGCNNSPTPPRLSGEGQGEVKQDVWTSEVQTLVDSSDIKKVEAMYDVAWEQLNKNPDTSKIIAGEMMKLSESSGYKIGIGHAYNVFGSIEFAKSNYQETFKNWLQALKVYEDYGDASRAAAVQINIGLLFFRQKNNEEALKYYLRAQKIVESDLVKDSSNMTFKLRLFGIHNNIGITFANNKDYEKAYENYLKALQIAEEIENKEKISEACNSIGNLFKNKNNFIKALEYYSKSLKIYQEIDDKSGIAMCLGNIGIIMSENGNYENALNYYNKSLSFAKEVDNKRVIMEVYDRLADLYSIMGNSSAYEYCRKYSDLRDTLLGEESQKQIAQMQTIYETDKKDKEIKILNQANALKEAENNRQKAQNDRQRIVIYSTVSGVVLVLILALFIFRSYKKEKKAKLLSEKQKLEIGIQKGKIEHQSKEINDSITYAKGIQEAILPPLEKVYSALPQSFVLYKPKDVVSGDFFWFHQKNGFCLIAAADCTGHGVPGAFMSMINMKTLNETCGFREIWKPGDILEIINPSIKKTLGTRKDGMDIALCTIQKKNEEKILYYAGANRPLWIIRKGANEVEEIKATKTAIAGFTPDDQKFKTHEVILQAGDTFYIFSDGFADQFGGPDGKKLMTKRFKEILIKIQDMDMKAQQAFMDKTIEDWKKPNPDATYEQVDDILVIGVRA